MSLTLWLQKKQCGECGHWESTESFNYTYNNVAPMWYAIFPDAKNMVDIDGMTGAQSAEKLKFALEILVNAPNAFETFKAMNPENDWGYCASFKKYIFNLIQIAEQNPTWIWESSR